MLLSIGRNGEDGKRLGLRLVYRNHRFVNVYLHHKYHNNAS